MTSNNRLKLDQPACYQICIQGRMPENWNDYFGEMTSSISTDDGALITILDGEVSDQAALHGILRRIRDLGLPLISVNIINNQSSEFFIQGENPMSGTRSVKSIVNLALKGIALAMSVAAIVLGTLHTADNNTMITLLIIGLATLSFSALNRE